MTQGRPGCMFPHQWDGPHGTFTPCHLPDPAEDMPLWVSIEHGMIVSHEAERECVLAALHEQEWETTRRTTPAFVGPMPRQQQQPEQSWPKGDPLIASAIWQQHLTNLRAHQQAQRQALVDNWAMLKAMGLVKGELE